MKKALFKDKDEFAVNNRRFVKYGNIFIETEKNRSPKRKVTSKTDKCTKRYKH